MAQAKKEARKYPLRDINGQSYLEVKYRILWFREEHPDWTIETECLRSDDNNAVFKAYVRDTEGRVIATGHKHESRGYFPDFNEKAETGAVGRALALVGYGTQFAIDFEEGDRLSDAPVEEPGRSTPLQVAMSRGGYKVPFGKYRGRLLKDIDKEELSGYCDFIEKRAEQEGKPVWGSVKEFLTMARHQLQQGDTSSEDTHTSKTEVPREMMTADANN